MRGSIKRGSEESWVGGRGGIGRSSRNTPGGRGWSGENPTDGPPAPPPAVGGLGDPPPPNDDLTPVHPSGGRIAVGASAAEGSGSVEGPWRPKFMRGSASSEKKPPTTPFPSRSGEEDTCANPSPSRSGEDRPAWAASSPLRSGEELRARSGEDRWANPSPSRSGEYWRPWAAPSLSRSGGDRWACPVLSPSRSEGDWRSGSMSPTPPHLTPDRSSSSTPPHPRLQSERNWRIRSASSTPSSSTPPHPNRADAPSWRKESDDSPPTPLSPIPVTGWPQRPVPELKILIMSPGILGRAPTPTKLLDQYTGPAAPAEPSTPQSSTEQYDAAEGDPEEDQYDAERAPESVLLMWKDAVEALWKDAVVEFLNVYKHPGHQFEFYKAQVEMAKLLGKFDISVEFDHLKSWNSNLADDKWLKQALSLFLNRNGVFSEDANIIFRNMPNSLKTGRDIICTSEDLVTKVTLFEGTETAITSSYSCAQIVDAIISELLARLNFGLSWCGQLTIDDIEFSEVNGVLRASITRDPKICQGATDEDKVLDVHSLWPMIEPVVTWRGQLPIYFYELKSDLSSVTAEEVTEPWFHEYIAYHPSLVASMGRRNIEIGLYQTVMSWKLHKTLELESVFSQKPAMNCDWRVLAQYNRYLKVNFEHGNPWASEVVKQKLASVDTQDPFVEEQAEFVGQQKVVADGYQDGIVGQQRETTGHKLIADAAAGDASKDGKNDKVVSGSSGTPKGEVGNIEGLAEQKNTGSIQMLSEMEKSEGNVDTFKECRYGDTIWGLLEFKRHVHSHPRVRRDDIDECEIFLARVCTNFLCKMLRELLKKCRMTGKFEPVWSAYKASKSDPRRLRALPMISPISDVQFRWCVRRKDC